MRRTLCVFATTIAFATALVAQPPAEEPSAGVEQQLREALAAAGRGDLEEAIRRLEALAAAGTLPSPALSLLGTLRLESGDAAGALEVLAPLASQLGDPAVLYHAGRAALALGRVDEAAGYLERSVAIEPATPAARELGLLRGRQGDLEAAYPLLRGWVRERADDLEARLAAAHSALRLRRSPDAEELLAGLSEEEPKVRLLRGELLMLQRKPADALVMLRPLLENPDAGPASDARRLMAEAELSLANSSGAIELLDGRVDGRPEVALLLARALKQQGDLAAALASLAPFVEPGDSQRQPIPGLLREYGRLMVSVGRAAEAIPVLQRATQQDPTDKQAWYSLSQALVAGGRSGEAEQATLRFQSLSEHEEPAEARERRAREELADPAGAAARESLRLLSVGQEREALAMAQREARFAPQDPRPFLVLARILLVLNRAAEALRPAETACALAPGSADALYQRGAVRLALADTAAAEEDFRAALARAPEHTAAMTDLAVLLMVKGERAEARRLLERVLELRPDDALALSNLQRLRSLEGEG
jgi:Flp pilus assembly protein TadD